ncbi:hypothetical protein, partial [Aliikangiella sp. G2MR2-5]|uniref:hypothetical protein n=1 Tax=Aliikangiella sp. G2MR2-5 TaxID=2788943 RepID=UPI001AED7948
KEQRVNREVQKIVQKLSFVFSLFVLLALAVGFFFGEYIGALEPTAQFWVVFGYIIFFSIAFAIIGAPIRKYDTSQYDLYPLLIRQPMTIITVLISIIVMLINNS